MRPFAAALVVAACCAAQHQGPANEQYQTSKQREERASSLAASSRDRQQKPAKLVASLGIQPGATVADIGTGPGYLLPYLSRAAGPQGRVFAEDVFPEMIDRARELVKAGRLENVTCLLGTAEDPKLPAGALDLALMLEVYHHLDNPPPVLAHVREALRPEGELVIVDYYRHGGPGGHIRADRDEVIREVEAGGFRLVEKRDHIPASQYVLVFRAK